MIIVDTALAKRAADGNPIRVGVVGAGFSARRITYQIATAVPGLQVSAMANRTVTNALGAYAYAGITAIEATSTAEFNRLVLSGRSVVCEDADILCRSELIDVIVESTGTVEHASVVVIRAIEHGKHVVLMNVELDSTLGPILKRKADEAGVIITNSDGDEPGAAMNLVRFVRSIGMEPLVAGNLKSFLDHYRNPDTQQRIAAENHQKATSMTHFADGSKLAMELNVLANATGFGVAEGGMYGPTLGHTMEAAQYFGGRSQPGGMVDYLLATPPANGVFVVAGTDDPMRREYLKYLKMGDGPLYVFYRPYHLPQLEVPLTIARAALFGDAAVAPLGEAVCETVAFAKRELRSDERLDGIGGFTCYGKLLNASHSNASMYLPMGLSEGCRLTRSIPRDHPISYSDIVLPEGRHCDRLREEQSRQSGNENIVAAT
ncbi:MAG: NAD(P)-dependent oxidoreductase [Roseibium album]|uniref:NAD(P)H-dependent oxidoreductase n=1 Tax=Roseibium album TaxID=311410 RepID=UPI0032F0711A